ncbi:hypothetical protein WR25_15227 [Diploscapter pachys]|uniref:Uncharacterized protein n=1 Tax=Diploscapter pachys TaxID=2018661 RepID=A0A2A2LUQ0_9BILA|nr:hypothetical protein WR25_15227 [Diploscapter pachys]
MAMTRSLGEGKIYKMAKKFAYIQDERLGAVYFPIAACVSSDCYDLRDKFQADEIVIFTAQKQQNIQNENCRYVASSVVKKRELISCSVKKFGKVFVPYSARNELNKAWLGKGAEQGRSCQLKIFRQPDINQCRYVAFGITITEGGNEENGTSKLNGQLKGAEKQPDAAAEQIGVIVSYPSQGDCLVYSAQTGLARLPAAGRQSWMKLGRFLQYDVTKQQDTNGKVNWTIKNVKDLGTLYKIIDDYMDESKLHLEVPAVVNRVSTSSRAAWLWNDLIGRIYIPSSCFSRGLHAFASVRIRALYTGAFEDVPWSALSIEVLGDDDEIRKTNAQLLITDDQWVVKFIQAQQQTFFGFMDNPKFGSAFIAWTDLTEGDTPPAQGTVCRQGT